MINRYVKFVLGMLKRHLQKMAFAQRYFLQTGDLTLLFLPHLPHNVDVADTTVVSGLGHHLESLKKA